MTFKRLMPQPIRRAVRRLWPTRPRPVWDSLRRLGIPSPVPPTPEFKHRVIASYAPGLTTFVETGTYRGDTVEAMRLRFGTVVSIELAHELAVAAQRRFAGVTNVRILEGDSGEVVPALLADLSGPALFWLDGHWCGGETALGETETPLLTELEAVLARREADVVLVDDARLLGTRGYPSAETITVLVDRASPQRSSELRDDILRIVPR